MANIDTEKLHKTLSEFLENDYWAKYYGAAPSVAKEFIALEMYASDNDVDGDEDFDNLQKEIEESMEDEDKQYLAKNSPSQQERARFAKMLTSSNEGGDSGDGGGDDNPDNGDETSDDADKEDVEKKSEGDETVIDDDSLKIGDGEKEKDDDEN